MQTSCTLTRRSLRKVSDWVGKPDAANLRFYKISLEPVTKASISFSWGLTSEPLNQGPVNCQLSRRRKLIFASELFFLPTTDFFGASWPTPIFFGASRPTPIFFGLFRRSRDKCNCQKISTLKQVASVAHVIKLWHCNLWRRTRLCCCQRMRPST